MNAKNWDKYASSYHEFIICPFDKGVKNPLLNSIKKLKKNLVVADLGCGLGYLLPFLNFKKVYAIDFSKEMLKEAKKKAGKNVILKQADLRKLPKMELDVAIAVNSVLGPKIEDVNLVLEQIHKSLKTNGKFFGIFPSMESVIHNSMLVYEREKKNNSIKKAMTRTKRIVENSKYCYIRGIYDDGEKQKFFYRFELENRLKEAGFSKIKIGKVEYPWGKHGEYETFKGKPKMWDWFVEAKIA